MEIATPKSLDADLVPSIGEIDWNDLRYFLEVARSGSFSRAAQTLHTHQSTVSRRMQILEDRLRTLLVSRTAQGIVLTRDGEALMQKAAQVETIMFDLKRQVAGGNARISGTVRIGSTDGFGVYWITPRLPDLLRAHPSLTLEVLCSEDLPRLDRLEADIILRLGEPQDEARSRTITLGIMPFRLYASQKYLTQFGVPKTWDDLVNHHRIVVHDFYPTDGQWETWGAMAKDPRLVAYRTNSSAALAEATINSVGISLMSGYAHQHTPSLVPLPDPPGWQRPSLPVVLVYHEDLKRSKRVEVVIEFLRAAFRKWAEMTRAEPDLP